MHKFIKIILFVPVIGLTAFLITGIINICQKKTIYPVINSQVNSSFAKVSTILQNKCADCHGQNMANYPFYFKLPIASTIIKKDIEHAQDIFLLTKEKLEGSEHFTHLQLVDLKGVAQRDSMPPFKYKVLHWNAFLSNLDRKTIIDWIDNQKINNEFIAITQNNQSNPDKISLGKDLFFDQRLSANDTISCASCHSLTTGGVDNAKYSTGINGQLGSINAPTVFNAAFNFAQFWDGRAANLKDQANGPVNNPKEMGSNWKEVIAKLVKDKTYTGNFAKIYNSPISSNNITDAIASYEETLITPNSKFDQFLNGNKSALNNEELAGYNLFVSEGCSACHNGINLGSNSYQKMGRNHNYFKWRGNITANDFGRYNVTKAEKDKFWFKVPTLRNIELTYPYFHDGSIQSLGQAVKLMAKFELGKELNNQQVNLIVQFLKTLTGQYHNVSLTNKHPS